MEVRKRQRRRNPVIWLAAIICLSRALIGAQPALMGKITGFKLPEYYEAPNQRQLKSLLSGAVAEPYASGDKQVKITSLRVDTFREDGTTESVVQAPECIFDFKTRQAWSAGRIEARTGDSRMRIQGEGFLLTITNKSLTISNDVRTVIRDLGDKPLTP
jgi:hypothetical protein